MKTLSRWKSATIDGINTVPQSSGVYVIYLDGLLRYVGESKNLRKRLNGHLKRALGVLAEASQLTFKYREIEEREQLEIRLIKRLKPVSNRQHVLRSQRISSGQRIYGVYRVQRTKITPPKKRKVRVERKIQAELLATWQHINEALRVWNKVNGRA